MCISLSPRSYFSCAKKFLGKYVVLKGPNSFVFDVLIELMQNLTVSKRKSMFLTHDYSFYLVISLEMFKTVFHTAFIIRKYV